MDKETLKLVKESEERVKKLDIENDKLSKELERIL